MIADEVEAEEREVHSLYTQHDGDDVGYASVDVIGPAHCASPQGPAVIHSLHYYTVTTPTTLAMFYSIAVTQLTVLLTLTSSSVMRLFHS